MVHQKQSIYFYRFRVPSIRRSLLYTESFSVKDEDDLEDPPEPLADLYLFIGGIKVHASIKVSKIRGRISHIVSLSMARPALELFSRSKRFKRSLLLEDC
jgi:hypothetical protein